MAGQSISSSQPSRTRSQRLRISCLCAGPARSLLCCAILGLYFDSAPPRRRSCETRSCSPAFAQKLGGATSHRATGPEANERGPYLHGIQNRGPDHASVDRIRMHTAYGILNCSCIVPYCTIRLLSGGNGDAFGLTPLFALHRCPHVRPAAASSTMQCTEYTQHIMEVDEAQKCRRYYSSTAQ